MSSKKRVVTKCAGEEAPLIRSLRLLDPLLQFLTKATGKTTVPLLTLQATLPGGFQSPCHQCLLQHIPDLEQRGILSLVVVKNKKNDKAATSAEPTSAATSTSTGTSCESISWDDATIEVGFPGPPSTQDSNFAQRQQQRCSTGSLTGSTKTAAKRRLAELKQQLKEDAKRQPTTDTPDQGSDCAKSTDEKKPLSTASNQDETLEPTITDMPPQKDWDPELGEPMENVDEEVCTEAKDARTALNQVFNFQKQPKRKSSSQEEEEEPAKSKTALPFYMLPKQASYSGSHPKQMSQFGTLSRDVLEQIPRVLMEALKLEHPGSSQKKLNPRKLYSHQATAIDSAVRGCHTLVCTSTGSGKSLCFLLPVLAAAFHGADDKRSRSTSLIMFPTKALAQDQLSKLQTLLSANDELKRRIVPATLDGDCPQQQRSHIAKTANVILTNPDTLHAAILPNWKKTYKSLISRLKYVVIDEAHVYEGIFGAHVALILSRLQRLCIAAADEGAPIITPTYLASSATLPHPDAFARLLCPIQKDEALTILTPKDDKSPRSAKHFFVWNPPLLDLDGKSTGSVFAEKPKRIEDGTDRATGQGNIILNASKGSLSESYDDGPAETPKVSILRVPGDVHEFRFKRRHAADETALLLARAVSNNIRCIAFCKTRTVCEWVYERTEAALKADESTAHLASRVESYRGGYKLSDRREIENKLFQRDLLGVVATSALELGIDIGGIDLTLHCGYPASISSLLQQAGRAGRGGAALGPPSLSVVVAFGSPSEQHLWKRPERLLSRGISAALSIPINTGLVQGHLLCASKELPITGTLPVSALSNRPSCDSRIGQVLNDRDLFGSEETYTEALDNLLRSGSVKPVSIPTAFHGDIVAYKSRAFIDKPWCKVNIRSIEPVNFSIVDVSRQGGRMDGVHDDNAVLDNLPYSRVFYHAFPGSIILFRGRKFRVLSMTRPPPFDPCSIYRSNVSLAAFAKPTREKYFTRPLSTSSITVVKQMERVDITNNTSEQVPTTAPENSINKSCGNAIPQKSPTSIAQNLTGGADSIEGSDGSFAGCGIVTVKKSVHGYKKLSMITRAELSRHELDLPPMEFDTFGLWIDAEAEVLVPFLGQEKFGWGVHALSHALLAVAPLHMVCFRGDLECDHSSFSPTRVCLFDLRAGGSGTCSELWKSLFVQNGLLESAIDLLSNCQSCSGDNYDGGCPGCLQTGQCTQFNSYLSKCAALAIANRMLKRIKASAEYKSNSSNALDNEVTACSSPSRARKATACLHAGTPRKRARHQALRNAKNLESARDRHIVVGRPSWPLEEGAPGRRHVHAD